MMIELPKKWQWKSFEDFLDYIQPSNFIVESTDYSEDFKTPVLTAGKSFILGKTNEMQGIFKSLPVIIFDDFTTATKYVNFPFKVKSSAMKILKPKDETVNIKFVYYYMQTVRITYDTHKRYWISTYSKLPVPTPPEDTQQAIVSKIEELFSELDKGIENLRLAQQQLKTYRQSVLKWAFEGKHSAQWNSTTLNELCNANRGISYGVIKLGKVIPNGVPCLRTSDVRPLKLDLNDVKRIESSLSNNYKRTILQGGELLVNIRGTLGGIAVVPEKCKGWNVSREIAVVPLQKEFFPDFFAFQIASLKSQNWLQGATKGIAYLGINLSDLRNLPVCFPSSFEKQQEIVLEIESRLSVADRMEESLNQSLQQAEALRQSILKKAFEGNLI